MIKRLEINYFRTHESTVFDFVKGINCIVGLPDSGKTNVIRSLIWVLTNRPLGRRMISNFSDDPVSVGIMFQEGNEVVLGKSKKTSEYLFNDESLKAIDKDVPDVIVKAAAMSDLNLQRQLDKPFLICSSPGEVAKVFNKVTRLEKPDIAVSRLTTDINSENKRLRMLESQEIELKDKIVAMGDVPLMIDDYYYIDALNSRIVLFKKKHGDLEGIVNQIIESMEHLQSFGNIELMNRELEEIFDTSAKLSHIYEDERIIEGVISDIEKIKKQSEAILKVKIEMEDSIDKMGYLSERYDEVVYDNDELIGVVESTALTKQKVEESKKELMVKAKEYQKYILSIHHCPYCDVCTTPIKEHHLDDVIKEIL